MFTGLIERVGVVKRRIPCAGGVELEINPGEGTYELAAGDSIAVEGVCLTVSGFGREGFQVKVSPESLERTALGRLKAGSRVNLERALRLGDRLGGHLVTGHVDGLGVIADVRREGGFVRMMMSAPVDLLRLVVEKGSIAVDGISLTVNAVHSSQFELMLIPETLARTTLGAKKVGEQVNLETDLIGKYVARLLGFAPSAESERVLLQKLQEEGFL